VGPSNSAHEMVEQSDLNNDEVTLVYRDYCESRVVLTFSGGIEVRERENTGFNVYEGRETKSGDPNPISVTGRSASFDSYPGKRTVVVW
jgi:hypothetical protein